MTKKKNKQIRCWHGIVAWGTVAMVLHRLEEEKKNIRRKEELEKEDCRETKPSKQIVLNNIREGTRYIQKTRWVYGHIGNNPITQ